jgi:hypothetical protein
VTCNEVPSYIELIKSSGKELFMVSRYNSLGLYKTKAEALMMPGFKFSNNIMQNHAPDTGIAGGQCICPNGQMYNVGVKLGGTCADHQYGCVNGIPKTCYEHTGTWSHSKVICDTDGDAIEPAEDGLGVIEGYYNNVVKEDVSGIGGNGGICRCPNGMVYDVGDYNNNCEDLACDGGVVQSCEGTYKEYRVGRKVECGGRITSFDMILKEELKAF